MELSKDNGSFIKEDFSTFFIVDVAIIMIAMQWESQSLQMPWVLTPKTQTTQS